MATSEHHDLHQEALDAARGLTLGDDTLVAVLRDLERDRGTAARTADAVVRALVATLGARDGYSAGHADAVHDLSTAVGSRLGLGERELLELAAVAMLHDVGKVGIPEEVMRKAGSLSEDEWRLVRAHPLVGERIVASEPGMEDVAKAVRHVRERWDGSGYPDGLAGEAIPLVSRVVHACSAWQALLSARPHRAPLPLERAFAELRAGAGTQFDPQVVDELLAIVASPAAGAPSEPGPRRPALIPGEDGPKLEQELIALIAVASAVAAANGLEEVIEIAAERACEAMGAASLSIERYHRDQALLRTVVNVGELAPGEERHPTDEVYRLDGDHVLRSVLEDGETHWCSLDDPAIDATSRRVLTAFGKHSSVAVPIRRGGEIWGQLWASRRADQPPFSERDARFLRAIASQVGAAIGRAELFSQISELASTDALTGLANRRAFDEALEPAVLDAQVAQTDLALVLCDLDDLKAINDHQGHEAGDAALKTVAAALSGVVAAREGTLVCRIGGDEFCLLLSDCDAEEARSLASAATRRAGAADPPVGVSCGVAVLAAGRGRPADLLRAADTAQYAAKRSGRGRVCVAGESSEAAGSPRRGRGRALRDAVGDREPVAVLGESLMLLDTTLGDASAADRLVGVARRAAEWLGAAGWSVARLEPGRAPRLVAGAGRPGDGGQIERRDPWLSGEDLLDLELAREDFAQSGATVVGVGDRALTEPLRGRLRRSGLEALVVVVGDDVEGGWLVELGGDGRGASLDPFPAILRVLVGEALRPHLLAGERERRLVD